MSARVSDKSFRQGFQIGKRRAVEARSHQPMSMRVSIIAVNMEVTIPKDRVTANPRIGPEPNANRITAAIKVVMLLSSIVAIAFLYPASMFEIKAPCILLSSRILSNMRTLASTAIPVVRTIPAIPGSVRVAPIMERLANIRIRFASRAIAAKHPNSLYRKIMKERTSSKAMIAARLPASTESLPKPGPTVLSSSTSSGAGRAPARKSKASSFASSTEKPPVMTPLPPNIGDCIRGALTTVLSRTTASISPTCSCVTFPNRLAPVALKRKLTTGLLSSKTVCASSRCSPLTYVRRYRT